MRRFGSTVMWYSPLLGYLCKVFERETLGLDFG
jgi:hypothetical protein